MDYFVRDWLHCPRRFPSACPVEYMGNISQKDHRLNRSFPSCNFSFILRGRGDFQRHGQLYAVEAPFVITQWPNEVVQYGPFVPEQTWDEFFLMYDARCMPWLRQRGFVDERRPAWAIRNYDGVMGQIQRLIALHREDRPELAADRADRLCEQLILDSLLPNPKACPTATEPVIQHIISEFQRNPGAHPNLEEIAGRHGLSLSTLRRRWFAAVKMTPGRYLLGLRLRQARRLLINTRLPVKEVAAQAGFDDTFYFSRRFRLETNLSPSEYRRRYSESLRHPISRNY